MVTSIELNHFTEAHEGLLTTICDGIGMLLENAEMMESIQLRSEELAKANQELNQRITELTALNKLFQKHLNERFTIVDSYKELRARLEGLARVLEEITFETNSDVLWNRFVGLRKVFKDVVSRADSQVLPYIEPQTIPD